MISRRLIALHGRKPLWRLIAKLLIELRKGREGEQDYMLGRDILLAGKAVKKRLDPKGPVRGRDTEVACRTE
jgi:hypothetical protein